MYENGCPAVEEHLTVTRHTFQSPGRQMVAVKMLTAVSNLEFEILPIGLKHLVE